MSHSFKLSSNNAITKKVGDINKLLKGGSDELDIQQIDDADIPETGNEDSYVVPSIIIVIIVSIFTTLLIVNHYLSKLANLYKILIPTLKEKQDIENVKGYLLLWQKILSSFIVCFFVIILIIIPPEFIKNMLSFYKFFNLEQIIHFSTKLQHYEENIPTHYYLEISKENRIDGTDKDNSFGKFLEYLDKKEENNWPIEYNEWYERAIDTSWKNYDIPENQEGSNLEHIYYLFMSYLFEKKLQQPFTKNLKLLIDEPDILIFLNDIYAKSKDEFKSLNNKHIRTILSDKGFNIFINKLHKLVYEKILDKEVNPEDHGVTQNILRASSINIGDISNNVDNIDEVPINDEEDDSAISVIEQYLLNSESTIGKWYNSGRLTETEQDVFLSQIKNIYREYISSVFKYIRLKNNLNNNTYELYINLNNFNISFHLFSVFVLMWGLSHKDNIIINNDLFYFIINPILIYSTYSANILSSKIKYLLYFLILSRSIIYILNYNSIYYLKNEKKDFDINNIHGISFDNFLPSNAMNYLVEYFKNRNINLNLLNKQKQENKTYFMLLLFLKSVSSYYDIIIIAIFCYIIAVYVLVHLRMCSKLNFIYSKDIDWNLFKGISISSNNSLPFEGKFFEDDNIIIPKNVNLIPTYRNTVVDKNLFVEIADNQIFLPQIDYFTYIVYLITFCSILLANKSASWPTLVNLVIIYGLNNLVSPLSSKNHYIAISGIYFITFILYIVSLILYNATDVGNISELYFTHSKDSKDKFNTNSSILLTINLIYFIGYGFLAFYGEFQEPQRIPEMFGGSISNNYSNILAIILIGFILYLLFTNNNIKKIKLKERKKKSITGGNNNTGLINSTQMGYLNNTILVGVLLCITVFATISGQFSDNLMNMLGTTMPNDQVARLSQYLVILFIVVMFYPIQYLLSDGGAVKAYCFINTFLNIKQFDCVDSYHQEASIVWIVLICLITLIMINFILNEELNFSEPSTVFTFIYIACILLIIYTLTRGVFTIMGNDNIVTKYAIEQKNLKEFSDKIKLNKAEIIQDVNNQDNIIDYSYQDIGELKKIYSQNELEKIKTMINNYNIHISNDLETLKLNNIQTSISLMNIPTIELIHSNNINVATPMNGIVSKKVIIPLNILETLLNTNLNQPLVLDNKKYFNSADEQIKLRNYKIKARRI